MKTIHCQAWDVAFIQTLESMFLIVMNSRCMSSPPICLMTGVLSDVAMIGMMVAPMGKDDCIQC